MVNKILCSVLKKMSFNKIRKEKLGDIQRNIKMVSFNVCTQVSVEMF